MAGGPVYFFSDATLYSQFHALRFGAPLPTYESITVADAAAAAAAAAGGMHTFLFAEQYMMYAKAVTFADAATAALILRETRPRKCKQLGRQVRGFEDRVWDRYKEKVVEEGNWWKFTNAEGERGRQARQALLATGDRELVEASPFDRVWGIGFGADAADMNRGQWGQNLLGKAIMRVRDRLREAEGNKASGVAETEGG